MKTEESKNRPPPEVSISRTQRRRLWSRRLRCIGVPCSLTESWPRAVRRPGPREIRMYGFCQLVRAMSIKKRNTTDLEKDLRLRLPSATINGWSRMETHSSSRWSSFFFFFLNDHQATNDLRFLPLKWLAQLLLLIFQCALAKPAMFFATHCADCSLAERWSRCCSAAADLNIEQQAPARAMSACSKIAAEKFAWTATLPDMNDWLGSLFCKKKLCHMRTSPFLSYESVSSSIEYDPEIWK